MCLVICNLQFPMSLMSPPPRFPWSFRFTTRRKTCRSSSANSRRRSTDWTTRLVFVDDGSKDVTRTRAKIAPDTAGRVRVLAFESNAGQSAAMYAGCTPRGAGPWRCSTATCKTTRPTSPGFLPNRERSGADLVCGYRARRKDTVVKRLTSRVANFVRSRFTRDGVRDTGCTLKAMRRECVGALVPFTGMHRFIPALVKGAGYRLVEIPVNHRARQFGVSKYGLGNRALRATVDMFGVRWLLSRQLRYRVLAEGQR